MREDRHPTAAMREVHNHIITLGREDTIKTHTPMNRGTNIIAETEEIALLLKMIGETIQKESVGGRDKDHVNTNEKKGIVVTKTEATAKSNEDLTNGQLAPFLLVPSDSLLLPIIILSSYKLPKYTFYFETVKYFFRILTLSIFSFSSQTLLQITFAVNPSSCTISKLETI